MRIGGTDQRIAEFLTLTRRFSNLSTVNMAVVEATDRESVRCDQHRPSIYDNLEETRSGPKRVIWEDQWDAKHNNLLTSDRAPVTKADEWRSGATQSRFVYPHATTPPVALFLSGSSDEHAAAITHATADDGWDGPSPW